MTSRPWLGHGGGGGSLPGSAALPLPLPLPEAGVACPWPRVAALPFK